jgi:ABC-type uncharacterized transport system involved in gliding motility auxiliary subunit
MQKITNIIGWIGTALVFGAVAVRVLYPDWNQYATWAAWAGLAAVIIYMAGQWRDVAEFYKGRGARYGTLSLVSIAVFLGILVAVNYLGTRQNKRWDLTENQVYSLSDQTVRILRDLQEPATITVFEVDARADAHRMRLQEYQYHSSQLTVEFVDPNRDPLRAQAANVDSVPTILVEFQGRTERLNSSAEQDLTNALIKAVTGRERKIYFTQGHGEKDPADTETSGYSAVAEALKQDNFAFDSLVLIAQKTIPDDATILVVAGPSTDFFPPEIEALNDYAAKGGKVLVMLDPQLKAGATYPLLTQFLADWGITAGNDVVVDASGMGQLLGSNDGAMPVAVQYPQHPVTAGLDGLMTAYPLARSMTPAEGGANGRTAQPLVNTTPQSWAEADVASLSSGDGRVELNADQGDLAGPITVAAAVSAPATVTPPAPSNASPDAPDAPGPPETRVVAVGDSDFVSNRAIRVPGNRDFFMNALNWLSQQENLIAVRPRQPQDHQLTLTEAQQDSVFLLSLFIVPGLIFASGIFSWWRRR